jgi:hypothetical protein
MESDALRMQSRALRMQQMQAQLGVPPAAPAPHPDAEETLCVLCFDVPKDHIILPCFHVCVCEACANLLQTQRNSAFAELLRSAFSKTHYESSLRPFSLPTSWSSRPSQYSGP